jgi:hypothetical protein
MQHAPAQDRHVVASILALTASQWWPDGRVVTDRRPHPARRGPLAGASDPKPVHRVQVLPSVVDFALARRRHLPMNWAV